MNKICFRTNRFALFFTAMTHDYFIFLCVYNNNFFVTIMIFNIYYLYVIFKKIKCKRFTSAIMLT